MPRWTASAAARVLGWTNSRCPNIPTPSSGSCFLLSLEHAERSRIGAGNVPKVMRHTRLPADYFPDHVPVTIIDTSCRLFTLERLSTYRLPELRRIQLKAPVNVVGCKLELRDEQQKNLEQTMAPIIQSFREIETCIECSALPRSRVIVLFRGYHICYVLKLGLG